MRPGHDAGPVPSMSTEEPGRGRRLLGRLVATGLVVAGLGVAGWSLAGPTASTTDAPETASSGETPPPGTGTVATPERARWRPGAPRRLVIPSLEVRAPVVPVRLQGGDTLVPPADPQQLGWWAGGALPGAELGSALVAGHTVHGGGGALDDLEDVEPGDRVVVHTERGRIAYRVDRVRVFSKGRIAQEAERLFSQEAPGRLVVLTCEDWDGTGYLSNVVVTATPQRG